MAEIQKWLEANQCLKQPTTQEAINKCNPGFHIGKIESATLDAIDRFGNLTLRNTFDMNGVPAIAIDIKPDMTLSIDWEDFTKEWKVVFDKDTKEIKFGLTNNQLTLLSINNDGTINTVVLKKTSLENNKKSPQDIAQEVLKEKGLKASISYIRTGQKGWDFLEISGLPGGVSKTIHISAVMIDPEEVKLNIDNELKEFTKR